MASESRPPSSGDANPAQAASEPPQASAVVGQVSAEPLKETPAKSAFVNSEPIREDQVQNAVKFLSHPRVQGSPIIHRRNFLERKGLTKEEIDEAFRRVPDTSPGVNSTQPTTSQDGQVRTSSNIQEQSSPQTIQPLGGPPSGAMSVILRQFRWYHAVIAVGCLAASGAGTVLIFKKTIVPRLRSWIRKLISDDDDDDNLKKNESRPSLIEEAAAAAAAAASDAAKASQEMVIMKLEENKRFEKFTSLLDDQLQEIKSMKSAVWKLEGQHYNSGRGHQAEDQYLSGSASHLKQLVANGKSDYDSRPARSSSPTASSEPPHPASYMEIMNMIQRGERPPNVRDINDAPPNPNQPISNPSLAPRTKPWETVQPARTSSFDSQDNSFPYQPSNDWQQKSVKITEIENEDVNQSAPVIQPSQRKWVPPQSPPVAMPEAAVAIRQPKSKAPKEGSLDSTSSNGSDIDELQKITKVAESGGEPEANGGGLEIVSPSETQEEQVSS